MYQRAGTFQKLSDFTPAKVYTLRAYSDSLRLLIGSANSPFEFSVFLLSAANTLSQIQTVSLS